MIKLNNISKSYGKVKAIKNISLSIDQGEIFGLIGADGAGKTTIFRILTTLMLPDSGSASIDGLDVVSDYKKIRSLVGYMPGRFSLYSDLTVEENIRFFSSIFGMDMTETYHLIEPIYKHIEPFKTRQAGKLSGGMKQKLALCCALIHSPKILLLDEPTTGVDVVSRAEFWDMLNDLKKQGIAILVSTPYMDEASRCDRIALINNGNILDINTPLSMINNYRHKLLTLSGNNIYALLHLARNADEIISAYSFGDVCHLAVSDNFSLENFNKYMRNNGIIDYYISKVVPSVEDVFIDLMA